MEAKAILNDQPVNEVLRQSRNELGVSQRTLAKDSGVYISNVEKMERGENDNPKLKTLLALLDAMGLDLIVAERRQ